MSSSSSSVADTLDFLRSTAGLTTSVPLPVQWTSKQNPFSNPPLTTHGSFGFDGSAVHHIHKFSNHMVFQLPMLYYGSRAVCFKQFMQCHAKAVAILSTLLAMLCEMAYTCARRSQGLIPPEELERKRKKKQKRSKKSKRSRQSNHEDPDQPFAPAIENDAMDDDDGEGGEEDVEIPAEVHPYPVNVCLEEINPPQPTDGSKIKSPVALRMHFFFYTKRTNVQNYIFQKLFTYELMKMALENNPAKALKVFSSFSDIHKISMERYWDSVSAYTNKIVHATDRNYAPDMMDNHPLACPMNQWHPFNTFDLPLALRLADVYGADPKFCDPGNYSTASGEFAFPEPKNVFLLNNRDLEPSVFFRLVFPCRRNLLGSAPPDVDPNITSLGAFHLGKPLTPDQLSKLTADEKEETVDRYASVYRKAASFQRTTAFTSPEALREYMDKELVQQTELYKQQKAKLEEADFKDDDDARAKALSELYEKHCDEVYKIRENGCEYFQCIWNSQSQLCPSYKAVIDWSDAYLEGTRMGMIQIPRKNFSLKRDKITSNISHAGETLITASGIFESGMNVINSGENLVQSYYAGLDVWSANPLKCNTMQTSKAGVGKSFIHHVLGQIFIPKTWRKLDSFTQSAVGTSRQDYDFLRIFMDEFSAGKVSGEDYQSGKSGNAQNGAAQAQRSGMTDMLKTLLAEGKYTYVRQEQDPETGAWVRKEHETDMRSVWFPHTNDPERCFRGPFGNRFYINILVDRERFGTQQLAVRQASTEKGDKTLKASVDAAILLFQRNDCMAAMINLMMMCGVLPEASTEYGAHFIAYVMNEIDKTHMNTRDARARNRALNCLARAVSLNAAVDLILDGPLAKHADDDFEFKHMLDIIPHLHVTVDGVVYALGALSGQHENVVMKELVGMIYKRYIEPAGPKALTGGGEGEEDEDDEKKLAPLFSKRFEELEAAARKEAEKQKREKQQEAAKLVDKVPEGKQEEKKEEKKEEGSIAGYSTVPAGVIVPDDHYYKIKLPRSRISSRKDQDGQGNNNNSSGYSHLSTSMPSPEALAAGWQQPPPRQTPASELYNLSQQLIQEIGTKGCHESDIYENMKTLANKMTIESPIPGDSTKTYAALAIDCYGILYVSKKFITAYSGQSSFLKHIGDALQLFHCGEARYLYGRTEPNRPTIWQTVDVKPRAADAPKTVKLYNAMYRAKTDLRTLQGVVDSVSEASGKPTVDVTDAFDALEYSECEVGLQAYVNYHRFAQRSAISQKQLRELGFDEIPIEQYLQTLLLQKSRSKKRLLNYPDDFYGIKTKKPKYTAGVALMRSCSNTGFTSIDTLIHREFAEKQAPSSSSQQMDVEESFLPVFSDEESNVY